MYRYLLYSHIDLSPTPGYCHFCFGRPLAQVVPGRLFRRELRQVYTAMWMCCLLFCRKFTRVWLEWIVLWSDTIQRWLARHVLPPLYRGFVQRLDIYRKGWKPNVLTLADPVLRLVAFHLFLNLCGVSFLESWEGKGVRGASKTLSSLSELCSDEVLESLQQ